MLVRLVLAFMLAATLGACTADGPRFRPVDLEGSGKGVIYVYRPFTLNGVGDPEIPYIYLNGEYKGRMRIDGHFVFLVEPGKHTVSARDIFLAFFTYDMGKAEVTVEEGKSYYLRYFHITTPAFLGLGKGPFKLMKPEDGSAEIIDTQIVY